MKLMEKPSSGTEFLRNLQKDQVDGLIEESPQLEAYKDELNLLRSTEGWMDEKKVPLVAPEGKILIRKRELNGDMEMADTFKVVDAAHRENLLAISRLNDAPEYARDFSVEEIASLDELTANESILLEISAVLARELEGYRTWPEEKKREYLSKWGLA